MTRHVLAVDLGTQSLRLSLVPVDGLDVWSWSHPIDSRIAGEAFEQDPAQWRTCLRDGLAAAAATGIVPDAIAACGPLAGFVPLDTNGNPLDWAVTYADRRPAAFAAQVIDVVRATPGSDPLYLRAYGADPLPQYLFAARRTAGFAHLLDATGYLNFLLTGELTLNEITALRLYSNDVTAKLGIDPAVFGRIVPTGGRVGTLSDDLSREIGWGRVPVIAAPFDSKCAYLASDLSRPGDMADISGTVTSLGIFMREPIRDEARRIYAIPFSDGWLVRGSTAMAGGILEWALRELGYADFAAFDAAVDTVPPGASGLVFLPYLAGERAPLWRPSARGAFLGLTLETGRAHMARAVYEGLAFAVRHIVETMRDCGAAPRQVLASGGLSRNRLLLQIKADVLGVTYRPAKDFELTTRGLAAIAMTAIGCYASIADAARHLTDTAPILSPTPANRQIFDAAFTQYRRAVDALTPTFMPCAD